MTIPATLCVQNWKWIATRLQMPVAARITIDDNYYVPFAFVLVCAITVIGSVVWPKARDAVQGDGDVVGGE